MRGRVPASAGKGRQGTGTVQVCAQAGEGLATVRRVTGGGEVVGEKKGNAVVVRGEEYDL